MNKQQITKQYSTLLICLSLVSMLIMFITPFTTAFKMDLGFFRGTETGMDYIMSIFDFEETDDKDNSSTNDWFDEDQYSDYTLIEEDLEKWIMRGLVAVLLVYAGIHFLQALSSFSDNNQDSIMNQSLTMVNAGLGGNIAYYIFCMYIILKGHEWDFGSVLSGNAIVTTKAYVPMIFQIIVFAIATFLYNHWGNAISGKVTPLNLAIGGTAQSTPTARTEQPKYQMGNISQSTRSELENLELLKKYKELFDTGVITEEEFNAKKENLLSFTQQDSPTVAPDTNENQEAPIAAPIAETVQKQDRITVKAAHSEKNIICTCKKCGYPINPDQQVCPHCSAKVKVKEKVVSYGMKWYKWLIYFVLFASAALNAISSITYFTGSVYGGYAEAVYETYPALRFIDLFGGILCLALAVFAIMIRSDLVWYRKRSSKRLCAMYVTIGIFNLLYPLVLTFITQQNLITAGAVSSFIGGLVMAIINHNYFKKRKDIFKF